MMNLETLKSEIVGRFPKSAFQYENTVGANVLTVPKEEVIGVLRHLKESGQFDFLMHVAAADYPDRKKRFEVVYELFSSKNYSRLRLKTAVGENETIETACSVWRSGDTEAAAYDLAAQSRPAGNHR